MNNTELSFWWKEGFYDYPIEGGVGITTEHWQSLLKGQENGKQITTGEDGYPILVDPPGPTEQELIEQEIAEYNAYLSSTDKYATKCGELGLKMQEEYPERFAKRAGARARINELRAKLTEMKETDE